MSVTDEINDEVRYEVLRRIKQAERIAITGHVSPDDDSIASVISTHYFITHVLGKEARILYPGRRLPRWKPFDLYENVTFTSNLAENLQGCDLVIFVDGNQLHRFGLEELEAESICIDHHHYESLDFDLNVIDPTAASTTEMIESLFFHDALDEDIAPVLLMGIIGDTGMFRFLTPKNAQVLITAHRLIMEAGLDVQDFISGYHRRSLAAHPLYARLLDRSEIIEIEGWPRVIYSYLTDEEVEGASDDDVSEAAHSFVSYSLQIDSISWTFVATPRSDDTAKISFRSLPGTVNVKDLAVQMGIGGGHNRAAGAAFDSISAEEAVERILTWCREHDVPKDEL